jgi:integrase
MSASVLVPVSASAATLPGKHLHGQSHLGRTHRAKTTTEVLEGKVGLRRPKAVRLTEHVKAYVAYTAKSNATSYKDQPVLDSFIASVGERTLDEVSAFHVERWKQERAEDVSKSTVNRELNIIRGCFSRAVGWGRLALSPLRSVKPYKVDDQRIRVLSDEELKLVLSASSDVVLICRVTLISLNRISEVLGLRREHLGPSWMEVRRKGGRVHRVALPDELRTALLERCHKRSGFVFGERRGRRAPHAADRQQSRDSGDGLPRPDRGQPSHHAAHRRHFDARARDQPARDSIPRRLDIAPDARAVRPRP